MKCKLTNVRFLSDVGSPDTLSHRFQEAGFEVTPIAIRNGLIAIDRVNMSVIVPFRSFCSFIKLTHSKVRLLLASGEELKRPCYFSRNEILLEIRHKLVCDAFFSPIYSTFLSSTQSDCLFMNCHEVSLQPL